MKAKDIIFKGPHYLLLKEMLGLAIPIISVRVFYIVVGVIGMLLLSHLGKTQLAAGALVTAITTTIIVIALSPLLSISILVGKLYGENKLTEIGQLLRLSWLISIFIGIIVAIILCHLDHLLYRLHQPAILIPLVRSYLHGLAWGVIPSFIIACCQQLCFAIRRENLVVLWGGISLIFSITLGIFFIFGYVGFPGLGFSGWPYAGSVVTWALLIGIFVYLYKSEKFQPFQLFRWNNTFNFSQLKNILNLSWPITVQFSGELLAFAVLNIMVGWLGANELSVQQILTQCSTLVFMIPMGCSQACSILISQKIGRNENSAIKNICYVSIYFVAFCMVIIGLLYWLYPMAIIRLYMHSVSNGNLVLVNTAILMLTMVAFTQIVDAIRNVVVGALRGLQDVRLPMWINIILLWGVALPLGYILGFPMKQGIWGLNLGFLIAFTFGALMMIYRFYTKTKLYTDKSEFEKPEVYV